jgi:hypothetical protein
MSDTTRFGDHPRRRSPSFPFISLGKAIERARAIAEVHKRSATSLTALGKALGYAPKSSGLLQTVAALRAYGLIEDIGQGENRRIRLSDLAWRILHDTRLGGWQEAIREAAMRPRLIAEYAKKWLPNRPTAHDCISELHLDRGFNTEAAKLFLKVFDETILLYLQESDSLSEAAVAVSARGSLTVNADVDSAALPPRASLRGSGTLTADAAVQRSAPVQVSFLGDRLEVRAVLRSQKGVARLIDALQANQPLLPADE